MKILLTGSSGFVGINLSKKLSELGNTVVGIDKNYSENEYLSQFFQYNLSNLKFNEIRNEVSFKNLDILIHCAAAKGDYNLTSNDFYVDNVKASKGVIKLAETCDIRNIIHFSTVSVYGHDNVLFNENADLNPTNPYGVTKLESENLFIKWCNLDSTKNKLTILRPSVIYGENNFANMYNLLNQLSKKFPVSVGNGDYIKTMVAVENIVDITIFSMENLEGLQIYNCTDEPYPKLKEVIGYISEVEGFSKPNILIPEWLAYTLAAFFEFSSILVKKDLGITRERIYKYTMPTHYRSEKLHSIGYIQKHSVKDRIQNMAKWYNEIKYNE